MLQRRRNVFKIGRADFVKLLTGGGGGGGQSTLAHRKYVIVNNTRFC